MPCQLFLAGGLVFFPSFVGLIPHLEANGMAGLTAMVAMVRRLGLFLIGLVAEGEWPKAIGLKGSSPTESCLGRAPGLFNLHP